MIELFSMLQAYQTHGQSMRPAGHEFDMLMEKQTSKKKEGSSVQVARPSIYSRVCSKTTPLDSRRLLLKSHTAQAALLCAAAWGRGKESGPK